MVGRMPSVSPTNVASLLCPLQLPTGDTEGAVGAPTTQGPPLTANLLLATGRPPQLSLSQRALGVLLELAQEQGAFNRNITSSTVGPCAPSLGPGQGPGHPGVIQGCSSPGACLCVIQLFAQTLLVTGAVPAGAQ